MSRVQFAVLVTVIVCCAVIMAMAQSYGVLGFGQISPTVASCPTGQTNMTFLCTVGTSPSYQIYVSFNGAAYQPLVPAATAAGVTSFNGRTGTVTLTKSDVTGTGVAATTTATTTLQ